MMNNVQEVFTIFFAVFWGFIANVQSGWKAFNWPFVQEPQARHRACLSMLVLNILPILFFGLAMFDLGGSNTSWTDSGVLRVVFFGAFPALGAFAFYRLWLGIVKLFPPYFYPSDKDTGRYITEGRDSHEVPIETNTAKKNILTALLYLDVSAGLMALHALLKGCN